MSYEDDWRRELTGAEGAGRFAPSAEDRFAGVLRGLGALLTALAGDPRGAAAEPPRAAAARPGSEMPRAASAPRPPGPIRRAPPGDPREPGGSAGVRPGGVPAVGSDIELVLDDARERAHRIIDDSVAEAQELLLRRGGADGGAALERVDRAVAALTAEVRDIRERLERIEAILRGDAAPVPPAGVPPTVAPESRGVPPLVPPPARPEPPVEQPTAAVAPSAPPPEQARTSRPLSVVPPTLPPDVLSRSAPSGPAPFEPPLREAVGQNPPSTQEPRAPTRPPEPAEPGEETPPPADAGAAAAPEAPIAERAAPVPMPSAGAGAPPAPAAERAAEAEAGAADRFSPDAGPVTLSISPVSGFQGLMRVQDALAHLGAVREATVEAYSQGEARLRLQLREPVTTTEIAAGLAGRLDQRTHVEAGSVSERTLRVKLG